MYSNMKILSISALCIVVFLNQVICASEFSPAGISGISLLEGLGLPLDSLPTWRSNVSEECLKQATQVRTDAGRMETWAMKIIDSSAKLPSGLLNGNLNQFGDFDLCLSAVSSTIRATYCLVDVDITLQGRQLQDIDDRIHAYRFMTSNITDLGQRLPKLGQWRWGVCVPSACGPEDISTHLRQLLPQQLPETTSINVQTDPIMCYTRPERQTYSIGFFFTVLLFALLGAALLIGSLLPYHTPQVSTKRDQILRCFSLVRNWKDLVRPGSEGEDVPVLHGARFANAIALLLSHKKMAQLFNPFSNAVYVSQKMDSELTMVGRAAILYTDSFIIISGMLTAFSMIKTLDRDGRINIKQTLITRYIRFTPNLLFLILTCTYLTEMMGPGPLWGLVVTKYSQLCKLNMWRNFIYIHNYFGFEDMCLTHTHQLGIDMQLFVVSPFLVYMLWRRPKLGVVVLAVIASVSTYLRYTVALNEQLTPIIHYGVSVDRLFRTARLSYTLPTHRATVYILGLLLGYSARRGAQNLYISPAAARAGWSLAILAAVLAIFGPAQMGRKGYVYDPQEAANYNAFAPLLWCGFLIWAAIASWNNSGGWFSRFLCWEYFSIFSRISYAFYLVQFPVFFYNVGIQRNAQYYTGIHSLVDIKELTAVTILAVVLTIAVDMPFQNLRKLFFSSSHKKNVLLKQENNNDAYDIKAALDVTKIKNHG